MTELMESYYLDWANLLLRWVHVITAIAWIGSSFYFVFLDSSLTPPVDEDLKKQGVSGELWAVHGGGFYHPVKFNVSSAAVAGAFALVLLGELQYLVDRVCPCSRCPTSGSASTYLIDKSRMDWPPWQGHHGGAAVSGGVLAAV